jgi:hypothetical protein
VEIVFARIAGTLSVIIRGPETAAVSAKVPADGAWLGIRFQSGSFMPAFDYAALKNCSLQLPLACQSHFWLNGSRWEVPTFDNADEFAARLVRLGELTSDSIVSAVLAGSPVSRFEPRTWQRRFNASTGLSHRAIRMITRAQEAAIMLRDGHSVGDTTYAVGYSDQAHLTRSLRAMIGLTPGQLVAEDTAQLSFIPNLNQRDG